MNITSNGGNIGRIHWINGDPALSIRERLNRYLANKWGVRCSAYGKPVAALFGRVWWQEGSDQPEITPTPARWNPPEFIPSELPELRAWYKANDGVYVDSKTGQHFLRDLSGNGGRLIVADGVKEVIFTDNH